MASNPAEQNVDYWRGRWADTASALTDAINQRNHTVEWVNTCVGLLRSLEGVAGNDRLVVDQVVDLLTAITEGEE